MTSLPSFSSPCIAPDSTGQLPYLFGVSSSSSGNRLEAYSLDISNPLAPTSTFISATTTPGWDPQYSLGCYAYLGDRPPPDSPISLIQFGETVQTLFFPNGTWLTSIGQGAEGATVDYVSPKYFSIVASTNGWNWFLARMAGGSWRDLRIGANSAAVSTDPTIAGSDPLLTVGAIAQDIGNFGNGLLFVFEQSGAAGTVFRATGNKQPDQNLTTTTGTESLVTLSRISAVNMNNTVLTADAIPVSSAFAAFILDKGPGGTISVFSIDPRSSTSRLARASINSSSPPFLSNQSVATLNSKIVVYGGLLQDGKGSSTDVHVFDVISGSWSGPSLISPSHSKAGKMSPGVIGGIAAAVVLVLIALIGLFVWRIRRRKAQTSVRSHSSNEQRDRNSQDNKNAMINLMNMENRAISAPGRSDQQRQDQQHMDVDYESSVTLADGAGISPRTTAPNTPKSSKGQADGKQYRTHSSRSRQPSKQPSRQNSARSTETSATHISLFPASSNVYLVDSPSILPPIPMIPMAYTTNNMPPLQLVQQYSYNNTSGQPNASPSNSSKKMSAYKALVPDDYDDRQPFHRTTDSASEERFLYQRMSTTAGSSGSPDSINTPWTGGGGNGQEPSERSRPSPSSSKSRIYGKSSNSRNLNSSGYNGMGSPSSSPRTAAQRYPAGETMLFSTSASSPSSPALSEGDPRRTSKRSSTTKSKRKHMPSYLRSKTDPLLNTMSGLGSGSDALAAAGGRASNNPKRRDSATYKVEYKESRSPRQQASNIFSHNGSAFPGSASTTPTLKPSEADARFTEGFPMPPTPTFKDSYFSDGTTVLPSLSSPSSPRHSTSAQRQKQHQQYLDWYQQQQQIQIEQERAAAIAAAAAAAVAQTQPQTQVVPGGKKRSSSALQSPRTPKLGLLPRLAAKDDKE